MKTIGSVVTAALVLVPWCIAPLVAQDPVAPEKKITITKHTVRPDGTVEDETIIKKGAAAESFDVEAYLKENEQEGVSIQIREEAADGSYSRTLRRDNPKTIRIDTREIERAVEQAGRALEKTMDDVVDWVGDDPSDTRAFLGVQEDADEDPEEEGLVVDVVRCSAAAMAGLKSNDKILYLNHQPINRWSDLTGFMKNVKAGDRILIRYERNGTVTTAEAVLTTRSQADNHDCQTAKRGFLGVTQASDETSKGVKINVVQDGAAAKAGLNDGDILLQLDDSSIRDWEDIEDFMSGTTAGQAVKITFQRDGKKMGKEAILGESKGLKLDFDGDFNIEVNPEMDKAWNWDWNDVEIDERSKEACLGVYSSGEPDGARITEFTDGSAAREAGMQPDDIITAINGSEIANHDDLWNEISKFKPEDNVTVRYLRNGQTQTTEVRLKACQDQKQVRIITRDDAGPREERRFYTWNWGEEEEKRLRNRQVIPIRKSPEETLPQADAPLQATADRSLDLKTFKAYPNPTSGPLTIEFSAASAPTVVSLLDLSGRQLFREELNAFNGNYLQQFDLKEYAGGTILVQVVQQDKVFTEQVVVN